MSGVMITDGGPHPADKWAVTTANQITGLIEILPTASSGATIAKAKFGVTVMEILHAAHEATQKAERAKCHADGDKNLVAPLDPSSQIDKPLAAIIAATKGTMFEAWGADTVVQGVIRDTIGKDLATTMHVERDWHAKGHHISKNTGKSEPRRGFDPNSPQVKAWHGEAPASPPPLPKA